MFFQSDLSRQTPAEREQALGYVNNFVASQDDPVIIFGDFGIPAWAPAFGRFLDSSGLEVKTTCSPCCGTSFFRRPGI